MSVSSNMSRMYHEGMSYIGAHAPAEVKTHVELKIAPIPMTLHQFTDSNG